MIEVILPAYKIPDSATVRKVTGRSEYILRYDIQVYAKESVDFVPVKTSGSSCVFLFNEKGTINAIAANTGLVWITTYEDLYDFLDGELEDIPQ